MKSSNLPLISSLAECPHCGAEEYTVRYQYRGSGEVHTCFDGTPGFDNSGMYEDLKSTKGKLAYCRDCGGKCDPTGWMRGDGRQGPECEGCGITTPDVESWNRLMGDQLPSQGGEAVAWARQCDLDESDPAIFVAREDVQESGYVVPLYTHPADQVADAARWRYYAPKVAAQCGVTLEEMNATIDEELLATASPQ